jgi:hypothetical protein
VLSIGWAFGCAIYLNRSAERLRKVTLEKLRLVRWQDYGNNVKRPMLDELIAEIKGLKNGAFAPLSEQPFLRALLVPSGGFGLLAVVQRLLGIS